MHMMYFTERPYRDVPEEEVIRNRSFFGVPNSFYDPEVGARYYNEYIDEAIYAEELGFDAIMLNEHHGTPFCMGAVMNVEAARNRGEQTGSATMGQNAPVLVPAQPTEELRDGAQATRLLLPRLRAEPDG
jgi:alkanesulfonate monooxygenase SsuD/methylene tetrahydromethanopterin reductase-like flavin-dependent oxidoreductase (luciferase family)